jgi:hypothetical protein
MWPGLGDGGIYDLFDATIVEPTDTAAATAAATVGDR